MGSAGNVLMNRQWRTCNHMNNHTLHWRKPHSLAYAISQAWLGSSLTWLESTRAQAWLDSTCLSQAQAGLDLTSCQAQASSTWLVIKLKPAWLGKVSGLAASGMEARERMGLSITWATCSLSCGESVHCRCVLNDIEFVWCPCLVLCRDGMRRECSSTLTRHRLSA